MKRVNDLISTMVFPRVVYTMTEADADSIRFESDSEIASLEGDDELVKIINANLNQVLSIKRTDSAKGFEYTIDENRLVERVNSIVREFHIQLWMLVNKKTQWNRTSLKKNMSYANSLQYKEKVLELFLDAAKYGITKSTLHKNAEIKPIHKFIASKFQAMVEAQCPR